MVVIRFADSETQDKAVGILGTEMPVQLLPSGEAIVSETAVQVLAGHRLSFTVVGKNPEDPKRAAPRDVPLMIAITFPERRLKQRAIGFLAGRFPARVLKSGEVIIPQPALLALAEEDFTFTVLGPATYEQMVPIRSAVPSPVQRRVARPRRASR